MNGHPFDALGPEQVLDAVEGLGIECDGRLFALNSFENRVYQVGRRDGDPLIAKFYRPGRLSDAEILEEHAFLAELAAAELPVAAPLAGADGRTLLDFVLADGEHRGEHFRVALFPRLRGRAPELESAIHLEWLGRLLARMHRVGACARFRRRPPLSVARLGEAALAATLEGPLLPPSLQSRYAACGQELLAAVRARFDALAPLPTLRLHGDLHAGNLLWNEAGPLLVDFDDCCEGPAIQDLWMLLPGDVEGREAALAALARGYQDFRAFDWGQVALIEALRALRLLHHAGWLSARHDDPAFPRAFPYASQARFWEEHLLTLEAQCAQLE